MRACSTRAAQPEPLPPRWASWASRPGARSNKQGRPLHPESAGSMRKNTPTPLHPLTLPCPLPPHQQSRSEDSPTPSPRRALGLPTRPHTAWRPSS